MPCELHVLQLYPQGARLLQVHPAAANQAKMRVPLARAFAQEVSRIAAGRARTNS